MNNPLTLRIMRSLDDSLEGPEYAINLLIAELSTDTLPDPVQEVSIRIYSRDSRLIPSL